MGVLIAHRVRVKIDRVVFAAPAGVHESGIVHRGLSCGGHAFQPDSALARHSTL